MVPSSNDSRHGQLRIRLGKMYILIWGQNIGFQNCWWKPTRQKGRTYIQLVVNGCFLNWILVHRIHLAVNICHCQRNFNVPYKQLLHNAYKRPWKKLPSTRTVIVFNVRLVLCGNYLVAKLTKFVRCCTSHKTPKEKGSPVRTADTRSTHKKRKSLQRDSDSNSDSTQNKRSSRKKHKSQQLDSDSNSDDDFETSSVSSPKSKNGSARKVQKDKRLDVSSSDAAIGNVNLLCCAQALYVCMYLVLCSQILQ